ncbi:MAG: PilZ domain-containing protein [Candidatus Omnitrophica bacterium]|nr:PilZ domain-containing protein [Candidatus Omnitrophota bacterium]
MDYTGYKEKRIKERMSGYHLMKYRLFDQVKEGPFILSAVLNISASGLLFRTEEPLAADTILDLKINFPTLEEPIHTLAKVVRVKEIKARPRYFEVGAKFIGIDEQKTALMDEAIQLVNKKVQSEKEIAKRE